MNRRSPSTPQWNHAELAAREESVWLARFTSSILAAGWGRFWMALACGLLGAVSAWTVMRRNPRLAPHMVVHHAPVLAPATMLPETQRLREEIAGLRAAWQEVEAARIRAESDRQREREDRLRAEQERDTLRTELAGRPLVTAQPVVPCPVAPAMVMPQVFIPTPVFVPSLFEPRRQPNFFELAQKFMPDEPASPEPPACRPCT